MRTRRPRPWPARPWRRNCRGSRSIQRRRPISPSRRLLRKRRRMPAPRVDAEAWSVMLYTSGTTAQTKGRAAPPARRARRGSRPCRAKSLCPWRAHARRHAALSHHGRALAAGDVAHRRRLHLPAPLRRRRGARADRRRTRQQSLSGADALSRPRASSAVRGKRRELGAQARLCRRADDRRSPENAYTRRSGPSCSSIITARRKSTPSPSTRTRRQSPARPAAPASIRWCAWSSSAPSRSTRSRAAGEEGEIIALLAGDESFEGYWRRPDADAKALRQGWYFTGDTGFFDADGDLFVTGRVDDMIITGGENVSPVEIEILPVAACRGVGSRRGRPAGRALGQDRHRLHQARAPRSRPRSSTRSAAVPGSPISSGRGAMSSSRKSRNRRSASCCAASSSPANMTCRPTRTRLTQGTAA